MQEYPQRLLELDNLAGGVNFIPPRDSNNSVPRILRVASRYTGQRERADTAKRKSLSLQIKSVLVAILNSTLGSENKGGTGTCCVSQQRCRNNANNPVPFASMCCTSNILGYPRLSGRPERAASTQTSQRK